METRMEKTALFCAVAFGAVTVWAGVYGDTPDTRHAWAVHDRNRPRPAVVRSVEGAPPSDAVILFDGSSLDQWVMVKEDQPCKWRIVDGAMEVTAKSGSIKTRQAFGDCQLHIEWMCPAEVKGQAQGRGNSGVFLMGMHEVQILDSFENDAYPDGQAGSVYAENPPMVNVSRKPGEWQSFDIIFHQPLWEGDTLKFPGSITVLQNGVVVQDHWELEGLTTHCKRRPLAPYASKLPLQLQDHGNPVRFRNIWIREIPSRYENKTHGGPGVDEAAVMALRKETAAALFAKANLGDADKASALSRIIEVISYDKTEEYLAFYRKLRDEYLQALNTMERGEIKGLKAEIIRLRNECNVMIRNKVFPESCALRAGLSKLIERHELEKKKP